MPPPKRIKYMFTVTDKPKESAGQFRVREISHLKERAVIIKSSITLNHYAYH